MDTHYWKNDVQHHKMNQEWQQMTKTCMQLTQKFLNLFLTHIKSVKLSWDGHKLLKEWLNTLKIDKVNKEWWQNKYRFNGTTLNLHERDTYTHKDGKTGIGWTHTAGRII